MVKYRINDQSIGIPVDQLAQSEYFCSFLWDTYSHRLRFHQCLYSSLQHWLCHLEIEEDWILKNYFEQELTCLLPNFWSSREIMSFSICLIIKLIRPQCILPLLSIPSGLENLDPSIKSTFFLKTNVMIIIIRICKGHNRNGRYFCT